MPSTAPQPNFGLASFAQAGTYYYDPLLSDGDDVTSRTGTLAAGKYNRGQILNITPATGAVIPAVLGSAAPNCILAENADATGGSVPVLVYLTGRFKADQVAWPAAGAHADVTDVLRDCGIILESVLYKDGTIVKSVPTEQDASEAKAVLEANRQRAQAKPAEAPEVRVGVTDSPWAYMTPEERAQKPWLSNPPLEGEEEDSEKKPPKHEQSRATPPRPPERK